MPRLFINFQCNMCARKKIQSISKTISSCLSGWNVDRFWIRKSNAISEKLLPHCVSLNFVILRHSEAVLHFFMPTWSLLCLEFYSFAPEPKEVRITWCVKFLTFAFFKSCLAFFWWHFCIYRSSFVIIKKITLL